MSNLFWAIILHIIGIIIILAEFVIPSLGLLTVIAMSSIGFSLYLIYDQVSLGVFTAIVSLDILLMPFLVWIGIKVIARSPFALRNDLSKVSIESEDTFDLKTLIGQTGVVITPLRPAGKIQLDNKKFDVVSSGDFIQNGTKVVVFKVEGHRIVVKPFVID